MEQKMEQKTEILRCSCNSNEHIVTIDYYDDEDEDLFMQIHLVTYNNFWKRLWVGIRYAFGYRSKYGPWDEILLDREKFLKIAEKVKQVHYNKTEL